jgi:CDP-paratose 2-epimerase
MKKIIITGCVGFIGTNLALKLMSLGHQVIGVDNLSRKGTKVNLSLLNTNPLFSLHILDLTDTNSVMSLFNAIGPVDAVFHLAAQVAVTTSYINIFNDFRSNGLASVNLLEAIRTYSPKAYCLYASTNKVFGHIIAQRPVNSKTFPLNPYTPYGVSKLVGELYFTEYGHKEIGLTTCSLRQSCIYGPNQYGIEDQGWIAWFALANLNKSPVTLYGSGNQIRDLLYIDDLVNLYITCWTNKITGSYPVGGGSKNAISIREGLSHISKITKIPFLPFKISPSRAGDQPYFVADLSEITSKTRWVPTVNVNDGLTKMITWMKETNANTVIK